LAQKDVAGQICGMTLKHSFSCSIAFTMPNKTKHHPITFKPMKQNFFIHDRNEHGDYVATAVSEAEMIAHIGQEFTNMLYEARSWSCGKNIYEFRP
jgi:hypothetical protein